jgi:glycosyltransferase involved in cell wall biosynthesis
MVEGLLESTPARRRPRSTSSARAKHLQPVAAELLPDVLEPPPPESDTDSARVLVASHSHPYLTRGGAEIAAFQLFRALQEKPGHEAWFLGCQNQNSAERLGAAITQPFSEHEFIYSTGAFEWFRFANRDPRFPKEFVALLQHLQPDVVHFHHFINFGVEVFAHVRRALPHVKIVLTLHEYLAICHHFGQMITAKRQNLCYESGPVRCNQCFPDLGPADFFLRQRYIERFFDLVDHFICPSHFLADRFIAWGLPESRISVLENVIPETTQHLLRPRNLIDGPLRVGFFGQISRLKGIDVLFDTAQSLESEGFEDVVFEIHGDHRGQPPQFQEEIPATAGESGTQCALSRAV